jgi:hypothetical protein
MEWEKDTWQVEEGGKGIGMDRQEWEEWDREWERQLVM